MYEVKAFDENIKEVIIKQTLIINLIYLQIKEDYNDMLNFSSEIEFDDRFDIDKYNIDHKPDA